MRPRPVASLPVRDRSDPERNQRIIIVECALQVSLRGDKNLAMDLSQRLNAFNQPPLNAALET